MKSSMSDLIKTVKNEYSILTSSIEHGGQNMSSDDAKEFLADKYKRSISTIHAWLFHSKYLERGKLTVEMIEFNREQDCFNRQMIRRMRLMLL